MLFRSVAAERGTFIDCDGVPLVRLPWLVDGEPLGWRRPAPRLGEHSREVLAELGFNEARIEELLLAGDVVAQTRAPLAA